MTGILDGRWDCIFQLLHVATITRHKESNPNKIWMKVKNTSNTPLTLFDHTCPITGFMMNYQHKQCTIKRESLQSYHIFAASHSYPNLGGGFKHFFIFTPLGGKFPIWLIFFKWVTYHQLEMGSLTWSLNTSAHWSRSSVWFAPSPVASVVTLRAIKGPSPRLKDQRAHHGGCEQHETKETWDLSRIKTQDTP